MSTQYELPPLPGGGVDFSVDEKFKGTSISQDRALEALHKDGWTLHRIFTEPHAVLPLPTAKFPEGRVYLFGDSVTVVVQKDNGRVIASLPTRAALRTLDELTPDVLEDNEWAAEQWASTEDSAMDTQRRWHKQSMYLKDGSRWTVRRTNDGSADITKDGALAYTVANGDEADDLNLEPAIVELVDYVISNP